MEQLVEYVLWATYFFSLFFVIFWLTTFITEREIKTKKRLKELPRVTIIVPAYNEELGIKDTLRSLAGLDYPRDKMEIIADKGNGNYDSKYFSDHGQEVQGFLRSKTQFNERMSSRLLPGLSKRLKSSRELISN